MKTEIIFIIASIYVFVFTQIFMPFFAGFEEWEDKRNIIWRSCYKAGLLVGMKFKIKKVLKEIQKQNENNEENK